MPSVYLDCAATTPLCAEAREAMEPHLDRLFGNASEPHGQGREARLALESGRRTIAAAFGCRPDQVIFTSGGTEADNQAVFGFAGAPPGRLVVSAVEHSAVRAPALELARQGFEVAWAPVDGEGVVDMAAFAELVREGDRLAAVIWANNVTGAVQPVEQLAAIAHEHGVPFHADAVQAAPSIPIDFSESGIDSIAVSAHKLHGPKGVGCLIARDPSRMRPLIWGGGQEGGLRSGTENVAGVVGFAAAVAARQGRPDRRRELRDRLEAAAGLPAVSAGAERLPGHSLLLVEGLRADLVVLALDQAGYAVSAGSACASGEAEPSHVLLAQGLTSDQARSVIRVSIGPDVSAEQIDGFTAALRTAVDRLRAGALIQVPARSPQ